MGKVRAWKQGDAAQPYFPDAFEVSRKAVLQVTDIKSNHNKYYAIELHVCEEKGRSFYRVFTHYGRTDDLETNPDAGQKESRYFDEAMMASAEYESIYRQKTSASKGYKEVSLASSKIGSARARGQSSGQVDQKTLARIAEKKDAGDAKPVAVVKAPIVPPEVQSLVEMIYSEATSALTTTVAAKITANGIETPLGVLTIGQIEKGEGILQSLFQEFQKKSPRRTALEELSGEFYTVIPHRIGRTRGAVEAAVIDSLGAFEQKQETLQLMKDMLSVNGDQNVLLDPEIDKKYRALNCSIDAIPPATSRFQELATYFVGSRVKKVAMTVQSIYSVRRDAEWASFTESTGNQKLLFHGSRIKNWVGLLSRGILLPKIVVSMGVNRTDPGWLGHGIYFGDAADTSAFYTTPSRSGTRLIAMHRVALGQMMDYRQITYGLTSPPPGYQSCHGVRRSLLRPSQFDDDEYVIYDGRQQRQEYLVAFTLS
ncbi:MAG: WGR domain-containing protein [Acidobacteriota bacterium]